MLEELQIKDFALIDSNFLEFEKGFTVLSGETGAGKSIIIGALSFVLGGKAEVSQIRAGKTEASVTAVFYIKEPHSIRNLDDEDECLNAYEWLNQHGIQIENNRVILRRYIRETGKSGAWINNTPVTRTDLANFSSFLVDIHGQHEHQSLMKVSEHRKFLDNRAGITDQVDEFKNLFAQLVQKRRLYSEFSMSDSERQHKLEMYSYAIEEIEKAKLKKDEEQTLEEEEARLSSYEKIFSDVETITSVLNSEESVNTLLKRILRDASHLSSLDKSVSSITERLESSYYELSDIGQEFENYKKSLVFDPNRLQEVQDRLSLIYNLKKKYLSNVNNPLSELFDYYEKAKEFVQENSNGNSKKEILATEIKHLEKTVLIKANELSQKRKQTASVLSKEVDTILSKLGMVGTRFGVSIVEKEGTEVIQKCGPYGIDNIEFLISANPGSPLLPLAKIASGGELSRVMLALKTIFSQTDSVETLIFDEIDTGIGGEVAVSVGSHLKSLAKNKQIFCITHLASIAVYADNQIKISKAVSTGITSSNVHHVKGEERVQEIARMLSGDSKTEQSLEHAKTMLEKYSEVY